MCSPQVLSLRAVATILTGHILMRHLHWKLQVCLCGDLGKIFSDQRGPLGSNFPYCTTCFKISLCSLTGVCHRFRPWRFLSLCECNRRFPNHFLRICSVQAWCPPAKPCRFPHDTKETACILMEISLWLSPVFSSFPIPSLPA